MAIETHGEACRLGWIAYICHLLDEAGEIEVNLLTKTISEDAASMLRRETRKAARPRLPEYYGLPSSRSAATHYVYTMLDMGLCDRRLMQVPRAGRIAYYRANAFTRLVASSRVWGGPATVNSITNLDNYRPGLKMIFHDILARDQVFQNLRRRLAEMYSRGRGAITRAELISGGPRYNFRSQEYNRFRHNYEPRLWFMHDLGWLEVEKAKPRDERGPPQTVYKPTALIALPPDRLASIYGLKSFNPDDRLIAGLEEFITANFRRQQVERQKLEDALRWWLYLRGYYPGQSRSIVDLMIMLGACGMGFVNGREVYVEG
jgi:hypothetical protein